jgi:uncharacterized membrane protein HdeD (DUF308 family)
MDGRDVNREINMDPKLFTQFKTWSLVLGIGMLILGVVLLSLSAVTTFLTVIILGVVLTVRGVLDTVHALLAFRGRGFWYRFFEGILSIIVGVLLFSQPLISAATITFLVALFLIASGLFRAIAAPMEHEHQWGFVFFGGIISLILGVWLLANLSIASIWFIGTLVAIEIMVQGFIMTSLPFAYRTTGTFHKPSGEAFAR